MKRLILRGTGAVAAGLHGSRGRRPKAPGRADGGKMNDVRPGITKKVGVAATSTLAVAALLMATMPIASAAGSRLSRTSDQAATTHCDTTITGRFHAVINVPAPYTFCLVKLMQTGAVNVAPGAALSVTGGSVINGAITLVGAKAFTFCASSTKGGAIKASRSIGFVMIGNGGDPGLLAKPCGSNHIGGAVTLNGNKGGVEVGGSSIVGGLTVSKNVGPNRGAPNENHATEVEGNTVRGLTTCATNTPAAINDGHKNTFTGSATGQCVGL